LRHSSIILRKNSGASAYLSKTHLQAGSSEPIRCMYVSGITISAIAMKRRGKQRDSHAQHPGTQPGRYMCGTQKREQAATPTLLKPATLNHFCRLAHIITELAPSGVRHPMDSLQRG
jgi:hypothetical protein